MGALRKEKFIYLKKDDQMLEDDNVYVVISSDQLNPILKAFGHEEKIAKCINNRWWKYWFTTCKMLEENFEDVRGKIIEKTNREQKKLQTSYPLQLL